ncbi:MAG: hypothetical protein IPI49_28060 [Myxococcales bacterium]|nr:hypothetical protein [Myxococcales bacterium]
MGLCLRAGTRWRSWLSPGWEARLAILRRETESKLLAPLRTHGWTATIEREVEQGEYLVVKAERAGVEHWFADQVLAGDGQRCSAALALQVEHIFIKGELAKARVICLRHHHRPVSTADDFHDVLIGWNNASAAGKFAPNTPAAPISASSEAPHTAIGGADRSDLASPPAAHKRLARAQTRGYARRE